MTPSRWRHPLLFACACSAVQADAATAISAFGVTVTVAPRCDVAATAKAPQIACTIPAPYEVSASSVPASDLALLVASSGGAARQGGANLTLITIAY
jgi:hypothetical protein